MPRVIHHMGHRESGGGRAGLTSTGPVAGGGRRRAAAARSTGTAGVRDRVGHTSVGGAGGGPLGCGLVGSGC
eukprot:4831340-Amphidinium_carterae.1